MPSQKSSIERPFLPSLAEIINLKPQQETWCVGYAPSKGRRCHNPTNAQGRRSAMQILEKATSNLRAGICIRIQLHELAPNVLCRHYHQPQAPELVSCWEKKVKTFIQSYDQNNTTSADIYTTALESTSRTRIQSMGTTPSRVTQISTQAQEQEALHRRCQDLENQLAEAMAELRRVQSSIQTQPSVPIRQRRESSSSLIPQAELRVTQPRTQPQRTTVKMPSARREVCRQPVEGDCSICHCSLGDDDDQDESDYESESDCESEDEEDEQETEDEEEDEKEPLVWCKATCGINYHESCLNHWLENAPRPTCPNCRSTWAF